MERSEDQDLAKKSIGEHAEDLRKREALKSKPPTICPLMTIAHSDSLVTSDCEKEKCWWYNRTLKKCAFVHMAISLHELGLTLGYKGTSDLIKKP